MYNLLLLSAARPRTIGVSCLNCRERPLAFYIFTENSKTFHNISSCTSSGAIVQNAVMVQAGSKPAVCTYKDVCVAFV